jgi:uroporphyrinogen-III decarboxylase
MKGASKMPMTSRERIVAVAHGLPVDRVPVMYWLNPHTTCRLIAEYQPARDRIASFLARYLWKRFIEGGEFNASESARALPLLFEGYGNGDYVLELGADISIQSPELMSPINFIGKIRRDNGHIRFRGPLGSVRGIGGIYPDVVEPIIKDVQDLKNYQLPIITDKQFGTLRKFRQAHPETCIFLEAMSFQQLVSDVMWKTDQFMLALYDHPHEIKTFMARLSDWVMDVIRRGVKAGADVVFFQDDYGTTGRPLISPKMWREFTYPHLKCFVEAAHDAGVPFMLHSCGYQMAFLDDYVEAGIDILQSFQPKAGNDFEAAYEKYGDHLAFATGIDIQQGEWMSPQELRESILRSYRIGRRKGRHILGMTHMMQYTMPMESVRAIFDTVQEIQAGDHG